MKGSILAKFYTCSFVLLTTGSVATAVQSASGVWSSRFPLPPSANAPVYAFATIGTNLYVGGQFTEIADIHAHGLAAFDGKNWSEFGGGVVGADYPTVFALVTDGTNLYVGGRFTGIGGISATNIAKWALDHWEPLGDGLTTPFCWRFLRWRTGGLGFRLGQYSHSRLAR